MVEPLAKCNFCFQKPGTTVTGFQYSLAREISHVDKSIIEGSKDVADAKHIFSFSNLRSQADDLFFFLLLALTRCHF